MILIGVFIALVLVLFVWLSTLVLDWCHGPYGWDEPTPPKEEQG